MKTEPNNFTPLTARPLPAGSVLRHPRQRPGRSSSLRCGRCAWTPAAGAARPNTPETTRKNGHNDHKTRLDWFRRFRDDPYPPARFEVSVADATGYPPLNLSCGRSTPRVCH
jgi:hypothetical protein